MFQINIIRLQGNSIKRPIAFLRFYAAPAKKGEAKQRRRFGRPSNNLTVSIIRI